MFNGGYGVEKLKIVYNVDLIPSYAETPLIFKPRNFRVKSRLNLLILLALRLPYNAHIKTSKKNILPSECCQYFSPASKIAQGRRERGCRISVWNKTEMFQHNLMVSKHGLYYFSTKKCNQIYYFLLNSPRKNTNICSCMYFQRKTI